MKIYVLASGSEGNATFIKTENVALLIDAGKNVKYIKERLESIGESLENIDYLLLSHTHKDHTAALERLLKKIHPVLLIGKKMLSDLPFLKEYDNIIFYDDNFYIKDVKITTIHTSHDVTDSRNFIVESKEHSLVYMTDTGYINRKYFEVLKNKEIYLFESNHDIEMLMNGPYPDWLKTRVIGPKGHLSNKDASLYLAKLIGPNTKRIILMHLSHKNNTEEKALAMLQETFKEYEIDFQNVCCAKQNEITEVMQ